MQKNQLPYDTSFAYAYKWGEPERDLEKALQILTTIFDAEHAWAGCPAKDQENWQVVQLLACNPDTPTDVLDHIAKCVHSADVLERVAGNPNVSLETLKSLACFPNYQVRAAVAENLNADAETIRILLADACTDVRFCLAENPNLPLEILDELAMDDNPYVAYRAQSTRARVFSTECGSVETLPQLGPQAQRRTG